MFQIFLLSVLLNIFGGALLAADFLKEKLPAVGKLQAFMAENKAYITIISLGMVVTGVLKLIFPSTINGSFIQDLIPALLAIITGICLFYGYYKKVSDVDSDTTSFMDKYIYAYRDVIGIITVLSGIAHYILPRFVLL